MQKEVETYTHKKRKKISESSMKHSIYFLSWPYIFFVDFGGKKKEKKKEMMCIHVNLKYHNHITFNQWILHLTYIYPKMKIKPEFKEVLAIKNKSTIT